MGKAKSIFYALLLLTLTVPARAEKAPPAPKKIKQTDGPKAPAGFIPMLVAGVMPTREGNAAILKTEDGLTMLPIWIGNAEAFSIQQRLDRRRFQRPLTHDLLDQVMRDLGGRLVQVQVDDLKGTTFVGTIVIRQGDRLMELDSRPSDAIALAVGNRAPIYVSQKMLERVGIKRNKNKRTEGDKREKLLEELLKKSLPEHTL